jgi:hypothetical protein
MEIIFFKKKKMKETQEEFDGVKLIKDLEVIYLPDENNAQIKQEFFFGDKKTIEEKIKENDISTIKGDYLKLFKEINNFFKKIFFLAYLLCKLPVQTILNSK